jgi:prepilin-type N-terminal cleavage/methylation domain-containing protein
MKKSRRTHFSEKGFSLIELMIVIAIIGLLIAVGTVGWSAIIRSGNENAAAQTIDNIKKFQFQYASTHRGEFGKDFETLIKSVSMDEKFRGEKPLVNGYIFTMKVEATSQTRPAFFSVNADPQVAEGLQSTGTKHYYTDSTLGTIKFTEENRQAKVDDPSL